MTIGAVGEVHGRRQDRRRRSANVAGPPGSVVRSPKSRPGRRHRRYSGRSAGTPPVAPERRGSPLPASAPSGTTFIPSLARNRRNQSNSAGGSARSTTTVSRWPRLAHPAPPTPIRRDAAGPGSPVPSGERRLDVLVTVHVDPRRTARVDIVGSRKLQVSGHTTRTPPAPAHSPVAPVRVDPTQVTLDHRASLGSRCWPRTPPGW